MTITLHPYLTGAPHRTEYLETLFETIVAHPAVRMMTGGEIVDWYHCHEHVRGRSTGARAGG